MMFEEEDDEPCQCGHGMAGFEGVRYQKGFGLLGNLFAKALPYLKQFGKYIGRKLLGVGAEVASDISEGKPIKESVAKRFKSSASVVAKEGMAKLQDILQRGDGKRRRGPVKKKVVKHKSKVCKKIKKKINKRKPNKRKSKSILSFLA